MSCKIAEKLIRNFVTTDFYRVDYPRGECPDFQ